MHCSQVSSGASNAHAAQAAYGRKAGGCGEARPAKSRDACGGGDEAAQASRENRPARNPLVSAMMEALKGLMPASEAPATSGSGDAAPAAATDASIAKDNAKALKEAAYGFAHELFQALKSVGASAAEGSGDAGRCRPHRCGGYGDQAGGAKAYGGLAQGLQKLAQSLAPAAAATTATTATEATGAASTTADAAATTPAAPDTTAAAEPAKASELTTVKTPASTASTGNITINLTLNIGTAANATTDGAAAAEKSPLLAAFEKLMKALNGGTDAVTASESTADAKKPAELLQAFLQQIAKSLGGTAAVAEALPAKGSLIDVSA